VSRKKRRKASSPENWPLWRVGGLAVLVFGGMSLGLAFVPDYSPAATAAAVVMGPGTVIAAIWGARTKSWWSQIAYMALWMLFFLGFGIRMWAAVIPASWLWAPLVVGGYLLAWALPAVQPRLSAILLREQLAPQTRFGQGCMRWSLALLLGAGASGYWVYEVSRRAGHFDLAWLAGGGLSIAVAIGWSQAVSHQLWPRRPWAKKVVAETMVEG